MKIRKPETEELQNKVSGLLLRTFNNSKKQEQQVQKLRNNNCEMYEWTALHRNMVIGYILFTKAYDHNEVIGLHLSLIAVQPGFQNQGVGAELMQFALRQPNIKESSIFTVGPFSFFEKFGFKRFNAVTNSSSNENKKLLVRTKKNLDNSIVVYEEKFPGLS